MSPDTYDVYFSGATLRDADPQEAKRRIGAMFKLEGDKLDRLFSGKPIPIKRGVDMDQAVKFRVAFRDAGALVDIVPAGQPPPNPAARPQPPQRPAAPLAPSAAPTPVETASTPAPAATEAAPPAAAGGSGLTLAEGPLPVPPETEATPIAVPDYGLSAPQGFNLSDCAPPVEPAPIPDISAMNLEQAGTILDESPTPEPLEIDTEALELDAPGVTLIETAEIEPPPIDIHELSMSEANQGTLEDCQPPVPPAPLPDIGHLKLEPAEEKPRPEGKATFAIAED